MRLFYDERPPRPVRVGDELTIKADRVRVTGWREPHKPDSAGFVQVASLTGSWTQELYAHVVGAQWIERTDREGLHQLTDDQKRALLDYAQAKGDDWKEALARDWMRAAYPGVDVDTGAYLQQIRNTLGPEWLEWVNPLDVRVALAERVTP